MISVAAGMASFMESAVIFSAMPADGRPRRFLMLPVLTTAEVLAVGKRLRKLRSRRAKENLTIFRLATGCGLRRLEISGLTMKDVLTTGPQPSVRVRKDLTRMKRKGRIVPLDWSEATLRDLAVWKEIRRGDGAKDTDPFLARQDGSGFTPDRISGRWESFIRTALGADRGRQVSVHGGRHTFVSHAIKAGRSLPQVRDAAGHSHAAVTDIYLHALEQKDVPDIYGA